MNALSAATFDPLGGGVHSFCRRCYQPRPIDGWPNFGPTIAERSIPKAALNALNSCTVCEASAFRFGPRTRWLRNATMAQLQ
jgi:hypothetical protein